MFHRTTEIAMTMHSNNAPSITSLAGMPNPFIGRPAAGPS
jgi:hypothetical protein